MLGGSLIRGTGRGGRTTDELRCLMLGENGGGEAKQMFALAGEGKRGCGCQPHHHLMLGNSCPNTSGEEKLGVTIIGFSPFH